MNKINFSVGQAAGVAVTAVNADATLTNTSGGASVFAGLVISRRGAPGRVLQVTAETYQNILGTPIHMRLGAAFEPYCHVERAVKGGAGYVVRVCPGDMKVPAIVISSTAADGKAGTAATVSVKSATFGPLETPSVPAGATGVIFIKDGDASANRTLSLKNEEGNTGLYTLTLKEKQADGSVETLESHQVSFDPESVNDMGQPAWLPTILESLSTRLGASLANDADKTISTISIDDEAFKGGSDGDLTKIGAADYLRALKVLESSPVNFTAILSLGCYEPTTLAALNKLAQDLRVDMFYDAKGNQTSDAAIKEVKGHGLGASHQPCRYYFPYACRDKFTGMQVVFGISCDAFVAKAKGVALVPDIGGWHYSPAGLSRAIIDRQNITPIPNLDVIDREAFVNARLNPVTVSADGSVYIDDALTTFSKNNYLRFQHVSSLMNAIARNFYEVAQSIKHEPDGVTQKSLTDAMKNLLERFYAAGALVTPRDTTQGNDAFVVSVSQQDIDFWQVEWAVCPTGSARRIVGKPILMR